MFACMKQKLLIMLAAMLLVPMGIFSQTYEDLWKQVEKALDKDLPKTAMEHLQKIEAKAQKERAYGQLLRATLSYARQQSTRCSLPSCDWKRKPRRRRTWR